MKHKIINNLLTFIQDLFQTKAYQIRTNNKRNEVLKSLKVRVIKASGREMVNGNIAGMGRIKQVDGCYIANHELTEILEINGIATINNKVKNLRSSEWMVYLPKQLIIEVDGIEKLLPFKNFCFNHSLAELNRDILLNPTTAKIN